MLFILQESIGLNLISLSVSVELFLIKVLNGPYIGFIKQIRDNTLIYFFCLILFFEFKKIIQ